MRRAPIVLLLPIFLACLIVIATRNIEARFVWREWNAGTVALALDAHDAKLAMDIGNYYFGSALIGNAKATYNPAVAERAFGKALAIQPGILWAHYSLARIAFARGDFTTALTEIHAELAANPENLRALYVRGLIYGYRDIPGDLPLAEADLRAFTRWAPSEWAGYNDLAWILLRRAEYEDALAVLDEAAKKVPHASQNPWLENDRGLAYLALRDKQNASFAFTVALAAAQQLNEADWRRAYTGDNPNTDTQGLAAFQSAIKANLEKARSGP